MPLATTDDVEAALGRPLTDVETARAEMLLEIASQAVLNRTGFRFEPGSYVITRRPVDGYVKIPATVATVVSVTAVSECSGVGTVLTADTDYTRRGRELFGLGRHTRVEISFTTTAEVPDVVIAVVAGIVAATISSPPVGATSEQAGPFLVSYANSSGRVYLSDSDKKVLAPWTQPKLSTSLL